MVTFVKLLQRPKAPSIVLTALPMIISVRLLQSQKAHCSIVITELGMVNTPVRLLQDAKANLLIFVTELGIVNVPVRLLQSEKA